MANYVRIIIYSREKDFGFKFERHIFSTTKKNNDNFSPKTPTWQKAWAAALKFNDTESSIK